MSADVFGRQRECSALDAALDATDLVAVVGVIGIGKTTLVRHVLADRRPTWVRCLAGLSRRRYGALAALGHAPSSNDPNAVADWLVAASPSGVVVFDDFQFADTDTERLIDAVVGRLTCVCVVRTGEPSAAGAVRRLQRFPKLVLLELGPIDGDACRALAIECGASSELAAEIFERTRGHPLWTVHAANGPAATSFAVTMAGTLDRLSVAARTAATVLGLLGRPATRSLLGPGVEEVEQAGLVVAVSDRDVDLAHAAIGEVAVARCRPDDLRALHRALGRGLAEPGERARHLALGGDLEGGLAAARQAVAARPDGFDELTLLAELSGDEADAVTVSELALRTGRFDAAITWAAKVSPSSPLHPAAAAAAASAGRSLGEDVTGWIESGEAALGGVIGDVGRRLAIERFLASQHGDPETDEQALIELCAGSAQEAAARVAIAAVATATRQPDWRLRLHTALETATTLGQHGALFDALWLVLAAAERSGAFDAAANIASSAESQASEQDHEVWAQRFRREAAWCRALATSQTTDDAPTVVLALCLGDGGDVRAAREMARRSATTASRHRAVQACLEWYDHDPSAGPTALEVVSSTNDPIVAFLAGPVAAWSGEVPDCCPEPVAAEGRAVCLMASDPGATDAFEAARRAWSDVATRGEVRCAWAAAASANRHGDARSADFVLDALSLARQRAIGALDARLVVLARRLGVAPPSRGRATGSVLTAREADVLRCVAEGLSSTRIAQRLGIAAPTVATHVRSAILKLGAANRREAAAMFVLSETG